MFPTTFKHPVLPFLLNDEMHDMYVSEYGGKRASLVFFVLFPSL